MDKSVLIVANNEAGLGRDAGLEDMLLQKGYTVERRVIPLHDPQAIVDVAAGFATVLCADEYWGESSIAPLRGSLRVIARLGSGVDNIDLEAASRAGVAVTRTLGSNAAAVAELAVAYILALQRQVIQTDRRVRSGIWQAVWPNELSALTVGVIGAGHIGKRVTALLRAFGSRVIIHDIVHDYGWARGAGATYVSPDGLIGSSDIITLHVPLDASTRHMVDELFLARMKVGALLINTSRGGVVDQAALYAALSGGIIAGAALDVFEDEPAKPDNPLFTLQNVIVGCHCAAATVQTRERNALHGMKNIVDFAEGRGADIAVNPDYVNHLV